MLAELAEGLLAVHGQSDQLRLLRPAEQRRALDRYAGARAPRCSTRYARRYARWRQLADRPASAAAAQPASSRRRPTCSGTASRRSTAVDPQPGEDDALDAQAERLGDADALRGGRRRRAGRARRRGATTRTAPTPQALTAARRGAGCAAGADDPTLVALAARLAEAVRCSADVGAELAGYVDRLDADPARLAEVLTGGPR